MLAPDFSSVVGSVASAVPAVPRGKSSLSRPEPLSYGNGMRTVRVGGAGSETTLKETRGVVPYKKSETTGRNHRRTDRDMKLWGREACSLPCLGLLRNGLAVSEKFSAVKLSCVLVWTVFRPAATRGSATTRTSRELPTPTDTVGDRSTPGEREGKSDKESNAEKRDECEVPRKSPMSAPRCEDAGDPLETPWTE